MPVLMFRGLEHDQVIADVEYLTPAQETALLAATHPDDRAKIARAVTAMRMRERRLLATATPAQLAIGWGDCYAQRWDGAAEWGGQALPACTIYGRVYTRAQARAAERAAGATPAEVGLQMAQLDTAYTAGWRHVRAYSATERAGEIGDQHVALMIPITAGQFRRAQQLGWPEQIPGDLT